MKLELKYVSTTQRKNKMNFIYGLVIFNFAEQTHENG